MRTSTPTSTVTASEKREGKVRRSIVPGPVAPMLMLLNSEISDRGFQDPRAPVPVARVSMAKGSMGRRRAAAKVRARPTDPSRSVALERATSPCLPLSVIWAIQ
ncbi:hypothetical protein PANT_3c00035 [Moesziomyces antarcticus T-34]|uniref:Uncharacterized protein n=1 Tax=Pseudozyma antarctica (strain T-34) TaxID=1151754 RepID=M9LX33_PSEA3|nr:hypothetical protein PANT_3c00035 [Moesziomyces antarcticus T-34]